MFTMENLTLYKFSDSQNIFINIKKIYSN